MIVHEAEKPEKCPECGGSIGGVEYSWDHPEHYDGVSEWACFTGGTDGGGCGFRLGRWSGRRLGEGDYEKRWGGQQ